MFYQTAWVSFMLDSVILSILWCFGDRYLSPTTTAKSDRAEEQQCDDYMFYDDEPNEYFFGALSVF